MEFGGLPADQRAAGYRELARTHVRIAQGAQAPEVRASHLELASLWSRLAEEAERHAGQRPRDLPTDAPRPG